MRCLVECQSEAARRPRGGALRGSRIWAALDGWHENTHDTLLDVVSGPSTCVPSLGSTLDNSQQASAAFPSQPRPTCLVAIPSPACLATYLPFIIPPPLHLLPIVPLLSLACLLSSAPANYHDFDAAERRGPLRCCISLRALRRIEICFGRRGIRSLRLMERFRRNVSPPDRARSGAAWGSGHVHVHVHVAGRKRPSIGRAAESFQSKLIASFRSVRRRGDDYAQHKTSPFLTAFFRMPNELHLHILSFLSISDLLALRRTSHALNDLIAASGPAIVRFWVKQRLGNLHIKLYPPPGPNEAELHYLLAMRRRHIACMRLTRELANVVLKDTLKHACQRQRQMWNSVYEKMIPLVFAVGYFLEEHRRVILERDLGRIRPRYHIGYDICTTPGITDEERCIFKRLDQPLRLQYFYMYCFILQVLTRKLRPPTCMASLDRPVRGWTGQPACNEDIAFVLVLGGISQVAKLLACKKYRERRRLLHTFITRLSPHESTAWRSHWRDLGVTSPALLDDIPCTSIGITQLDQIWEPLIAGMMRPGSREFTEHQRVRYEEVRASKEYINELMGYDILRGRPADGDDSDAGEEGDDVYV